MLHLIINTIILTSTMIFSQLKHPLAMGLLLTIQVFVISLMMGAHNESCWFSYTLFLVFIGGMLVLFIYMTTLASNEMFNFSLNLLLNMALMFSLIFTSMMMMDYMELSTINFKETSIYELIINQKENIQMIYKIYNYPSNIMTVLMINYLFLTLIIVVKITNLFYGPLRNMN